MSPLSPSQYYRLRSVVVSLARRSTLVQASWLFQTLGSLPFLDETAVAIFCSNVQACRGHFEAIHHLPYSSPLSRSLYHLRTSMLHSQQLQVGRLDDLRPLTATCCFLFVRKVSIHRYNFPRIPYDQIFAISLLYGTLSKAFGSHNKRGQCLLLYQESVSTLLRLSAIVDSSIFLSRSHIVYLKSSCSTSCGK